MATLEQRVGQLEGGYEHLATKDDLSQLEVRLTKYIREVFLKVVFGLAGLQLLGLAAVAAIMQFLA